VSEPSPEVREAELDSLRVVRYRRDVLVRAGYDEEDAKMLARRTHLDLHEAVSLVRRGCPSFAARRILL
jgi:hypothetical protein